jgi:hypothetical protein
MALHKIMVPGHQGFGGGAVDLCYLVSRTEEVLLEELVLG